MVAAVYGCLPVILHEGIEMPFEDVLPYDRFSVRVAQSDLKVLPSMLVRWIDHFAPSRPLD